MRRIEQARQERNAEIRRLAATMSPVAIAEQFGVHRRTVYRLLGCQSTAALTAALPAPAEEVYALMTARTKDWSVIRSRIDVFCRAIPERAFARDYRRQLLAIHRRHPHRRLPTELPPAEDLPTGVPDLPRLAAACQDDQAGLRDRALLLLLNVSGLSFTDLVGLDVEHIRFVSNAVQVSVDPKREWQKRLGVVSCDRHPSHCPVAALRIWLEVLGPQSGPVFRKIVRWGHLSQDRLRFKAVRQIIARRTPHPAEQMTSPYVRATWL